MIRIERTGTPRDFVMFMWAGCDDCRQKCEPTRRAVEQDNDWDRAFVWAHARSEGWKEAYQDRVPGEPSKGKLQVLICPACQEKAAQERALKNYTRLQSFSLTRLIASPKIRRRKRGQQDGTNTQRRNGSHGALPRRRARSV